jgi:hypothetical protein
MPKLMVTLMSAPSPRASITTEFARPPTDATLEQLFARCLLGNPQNLPKLPQMGAGMSPQDCRDRAEACEGLADSVGPSDRIHIIMREAASQWRRLADDSEAHERRLPQLHWARATP